MYEILTNYSTIIYFTNLKTYKKRNLAPARVLSRLTMYLLIKKKEGVSYPAEPVPPSLDKIASKIRYDEEK